MDFHKDLYITAIHKLEFHLSHVRILGMHHCGNAHIEALKCLSYFQYVLCCRDNAELVVSSFAHQIKSEYYGGNRSVSIEGTNLEHFSATYQETSSYSLHSRTRHAAFHYFLSDNSKKIFSYNSHK